MAFKDELLQIAAKDPIALRDLLQEPAVVGSLSAIGILPKILELHAPSQRARRQDGVGDTLCGIRGTRHSVVTCARCKRSSRKA